MQQRQQATLPLDIDTVFSNMQRPTPEIIGTSLNSDCLQYERCLVLIGKCRYWILGDYATLIAVVWSKTSVIFPPVSETFAVRN